MTSQRSTRPLLMMTLLVLAVFCSMAGRTVFAPLMPALQTELGFGLSAAGTLFLLVSIGYGGAMLASGFLAARVGHGKTIVAALAIITVGLGLAALTSRVWLLAVSMTLIGAGAGTYPPSGLVMISDAISVERRSTAFALHEVGPNLALLLSPLIVLAFEPVLGRRGVLAAFALLSALAAAAFLRWGVSGSGRGTAPRLSTVASILRQRNTLPGMVILSAAIAGMHGVYSILPAYLVADHGLPVDRVNLLLAVSRITGIALLLRAGAVINRIGRRPTMAGGLIFSAAFTAAIGLARGTLLTVVVIAQPALLTALFPAALSSMALIGDPRQGNITYGLIITVGIGIGAGIAPALLGLFGDLGLGWAGFLLLGAYMLFAVGLLWSTPGFGHDPRPHTR
ncbi:MAG: MFS transporter [Spirochaetaceae bacterium]|nr:MAG: MFS transporter [Spirochaetaceae bacterium]